MQEASEHYIHLYKMVMYEGQHLSGERCDEAQLNLSPRVMNSKQTTLTSSIMTM